MSLYYDISIYAQSDIVDKTSDTGWNKYKVIQWNILENRECVEKNAEEMLWEREGERGRGGVSVFLASLWVCNQHCLHSTEPTIHFKTGHASWTL